MILVLKKEESKTNAQKVTRYDDMPNFTRETTSDHLRSTTPWTACLGLAICVMS